jgi:hypothetical protein
VKTCRPQESAEMVPHEVRESCKFSQLRVHDFQKAYKFYLLDLRKMNWLGVSETLELEHAGAAVNLARDTGCHIKGSTRSAFKTASRNFEQSTFNLKTSSKSIEYIF